METYRGAWVKLQKDWEATNRAAREARAACTAAYVAVAAGRGTGASDAELDEAKKFESRADELQGQMDALVKKALGFS